MILEIGVVDDPEKVGFYSGLIESIFACMSFIAIMPSTHFSDRYGRKPVILVGILGLALSTALFGVSHSFPLMVVSRCLGGMLGGTSSYACFIFVRLSSSPDQSSPDYAGRNDG
jgi:MFS family permease